MPPVKRTMKLPNGNDIELFYIGALAHALGRQTVTVRKWEIAGIIPETFFRDNMKRRLYTQEQIDAIVECAEKAKLYQGRSIARTKFSANCHKRFEELRLKYKGE